MFLVHDNKIIPLLSDMCVSLKCARVPCKRTDQEDDVCEVLLWNSVLCVCFFRVFVSSVRAAQAWL